MSKREPYISSLVGHETRKWRVVLSRGGCLYVVEGRKIPHCDAALVTLPSPSCQSKALLPIVKNRRILIAIPRHMPYGCVCKTQQPPILLSAPRGLGTHPSHLPRVSAMASKSQRSKGHDGVLPQLDVAIQFLGGAKDACSIVPAQTALGSACALLTLIRVRSFLFLDDELPFISAQDTTGNKQDRFVGLGLFCAKVCEVLDRGLNGKRSDDLSKSVFKAIEQLTA